MPGHRAPILRPILRCGGANQGRVAGHTWILPQAEESRFLVAFGGLCCVRRICLKKEDDEQETGDERVAV